MLEKGKGPRDSRSTGSKVQGTQGPRYLKLTFKYELDSKEGPSCLLFLFFYLFSSFLFFYISSSILFFYIFFTISFLLMLSFISFPLSLFFHLFLSISFLSLCYFFSIFLLWMANYTLSLPSACYLLAMSTIFPIAVLLFCKIPLQKDHNGKPFYVCFRKRRQAFAK